MEHAVSLRMLSLPVASCVTTLGASVVSYVTTL
ncbi:hypothetical protein KL86DES1_20829 [uncultured Desulfovibrio sp.]|uniref:Uncharacterized protein n=1 Tax=uncultured Desulfovibrio sp. TaxID=167968 RepID=A0A212L5D6_9BACT|nr:hypothetical protein KL86DES1_20829 [uncultured Desulfovibrio sp.]VZH33732.1 conserved protein of unknown function [Desulfovibrio sp. 86]